MLEIRELRKTYKSKKGGNTEALKGVSLKFADTGLVFILGKSGCGKSTMLNLLGGLDVFDGGEIIVNGKSSKDFSVSDFDSYRNTYLGFVFQEFNIIENFTIEKNIELALQLQHKKADKDSVAKILQEVELTGFEKRKPNELSGGQKQRVAIARALIKDPEIILADEPTGALDSATGKSVMRMLKDLSKRKLVIIVSHDREFAEEYGDRIVELKDGNVIADRTREASGNMVNTEDIIAVEKNILRIPKGKQLDEDSINAINNALVNSKSDIYLTLSDSGAVERAYPETMERIRENGFATEDTFVKTEEDKITTNREAMSLIKSKLPLKDAFVIGISNFKAKKFRLIITIFLSILSLCFFGFADIFASYNQTEVYTKAFYEGDAYYMNIGKVESMDQGAFTNEIDVPLTKQDVDTLTQKFGGNILKHYAFQDWDVSANFYKQSEDKFFQPQSFDGYLETSYNEDMIAYGNFPSNYNEIMISDYMAKGYLDLSVRLQGSMGQSEEYQFLSYDQLIGYEIEIDDNIFTVCGIYKTNFPTYYEQLNGYTQLELNSDEGALRVQNDYQTDVRNIYGKVIVKDGFSDQIRANLTQFRLNMLGDIPSVSMNYAYNESQPISLDTQYGLSQGQVMLPFSYYKTAKYGYEDTSTFADLQKDFLTPQTIRFYVPVVSWYEDGDVKYEAEYEVVGIYDDQGGYGGGIIGGDYGMMEKASYDMVVSPSYPGMGSGSGIVMNEQDFRYLVNEFHAPEDIKIDARLSGTDLYSTIDSLFADGYSVTARNIYELQMVDSLMGTLLNVFYIVAGVLAVFVMLLLYNFISTSIINKKKEIGILRAIGARGIDIGSIFMFESLMIGAIILAISFPAVILLSGVLQDNLLNAIPIQIISFKARQIFTMTGITLLILTISSILPVLKISRKKPIDAILDK